jgi:3-deoxy-D-manno-octulosonic-acid transferase
MNGPNHVSKRRQQFTLELPSSPSGSVWLHACSVGEVSSLAPLIHLLREDSLPVHLTVVTETGFAHAHRLFGGDIGISYLPWDLPGLMRRFVTHLKPRLLLLAETEFWPGMLAACRVRGIPVIGVNTRISDRSYPRYRASRFLWRRWLEPVHLFLAQSELDAERLAAIGVEPTRIRTVGNLKFAVPAPEVDASRLRSRVDASMRRPVLLAASTHAGEDALLLAMWPEWKRLRSDLLLLLVPRHPQRFAAVAEMIRRHGFRLSLWSEERTDPRTEVVLVDAMGVLRRLYTIADIVIIGGSIECIGGHNPLEAAVCGRGVITGPYMHNFRSVIREMRQAGAAIVAESSQDLEAAVQRLLRNPEEIRQLHAHAAEFMRHKGAVLERVHAAIAPFLHA